MREIIFTGKRKDNGEWVEGHLFKNLYGEYMIREFKIYDEDVYLDDYFIIPETIGQYTGLTDKNGKMIFEGHILKWTNTDNEVIFTPVGFKNGCFVINPEREDTELLCDYLCLDMEIAGNIYDNPELL